MTQKWSAVILAGGLGSRLNPLTEKICKPMVPVANKPMVDYAIDHLRYAGIKKIIIVVKHMGELLRQLIKSTWTPEICQEYGIEVLVPKVDSKGTADAVRKVANMLDSTHFVVSMADIVTNLPMKDFMEYHESKNAFATVSMKRIEEMATKYGNTLLNEDNRIIRFLEKPSSEEIYLSALMGGAKETLPIINTGIYCFKHELLDVLKQTDYMDFGHDVFPYLLENKYDLYGFVRKYYWLDVGNPTTYLWANWDMLRLYGYPIEPFGIRQKNSHIWYHPKDLHPNNNQHKNHVCFGCANQFGENTTIEELVVIGSRCSFGNNVKISRSVIWDNCMIGNNVQIDNSVIANGVEIADGCIIRSNTIIGPNVKVLTPNTILDAKVLTADTIISPNQKNI